MRLEIFVCTVTYNNSEEELSRFAHAYMVARDQAQAQGLGVRLLCRDNGRSSGMAQRVGEPRASEAIALSHADVRAADSNIGYGPAMHALWTLAFAQGASAVVTANPDGAFHPQCLVRLQQTAMWRPGHLIEARQFPSEHAKHYDAIDQTSDWASGCCIHVSRDLFLRVGNLDPGFWLYMEDVDYSWRVRAAGRCVLLCPAALYGHHSVQRDLSLPAKQAMLLAGRRLGWKWGSAPFMRQCEAAYTRQFPAVPLAQLGPMPELACGHQSIPCFDRFFAFTSTRWTL